MADFLKENDYLLIELAKAHDVRSQRNFQVVAEMWEVIAASYNAQTGSNYTKKQLQKRLTNLTYRFRKLTNTLSTDGIRSSPMKSLEELTNAEFEMKYEDWNANPEVDQELTDMNSQPPAPAPPMESSLPEESSTSSEQQNIIPQGDVEPPNAPGSTDMKKSDRILLKLAKEHDIRHIRNIQVLTEVWEEVRQKFNKATGFNLTKKQCQKKLANLVQRQRKLQQMANRDRSSKSEGEGGEDQYVDNSDPLADGEAEMDHKEPQVDIYENYDSSYYGGDKMNSSGTVIEADDYEQLRVRAEIAKEEAEIKRAQAEEMRFKKEKLLAEAAKAQIMEAKRRAELAELELLAKRKELESILKA